MLIYNIIVITLMICCTLELFQHKYRLVIVKQKNSNHLGKLDLDRVISCILIIILTLIAAFRDFSVGTDLSRYIPRFYHLGISTWKNLIMLSDYYSFEYGFSIFCKLIYLINPNPEIFIIVSSFIIGCGFYKLTKLSYMPILTIFIIVCYGIYGSSMNIIRQFLSFSIILLGIEKINDDNFLRFFIIVIIASTFHIMALIFIPLYFLARINYNKLVLVGCMIISLFIFVFRKYLIILLVKNTSFSWYLSKLGKGSGITTLLFLFLLLCILYYYRSYLIYRNIDPNTYLWIITLAVLSNILALSLGVFARIMIYFTPFISIIIPNLLLTIKKKENVFFYILAWILIVIFFYFYYSVVLLSGDAISAGWVPYSFR